MSELPTILVTNGWKTDRNRKLTEIVIPSTVKTLNAPTKVTFMGTSLTAIPSNASTLQEFVAPNITSTVNKAFLGGYTALKKVVMTGLKSIGSNSATSSSFYGCTSLTDIQLPSLEAISDTGSTGNVRGAFSTCTALTSISLPSLKTIYIAQNASNKGTFGDCTSLTSLQMPSLVSISASWGELLSSNVPLTELSLPSLTSVTADSCQVFKAVTTLSTVNLPKLTTTTANSTNNAAIFYNCTGLTNVTLGSEGNPVSTLSAYTFRGCTQSTLTITVYTNGGASLANSPWGATNATIVYETA